MVLMASKKLQSTFQDVLLLQFFLLMKSVACGFFTQTSFHPEGSHSILTWMVVLKRRSYWSLFQS